MLLVLGACTSPAGDASSPGPSTTTAGAGAPTSLTTAARRETIAFVSIATAGDGKVSSRIVVADGRGEQPRVVAELGGRAEALTWSPDGRTLAFDADTAGQFDIWLASADGAPPRNLTPDPATDGWPLWSPDGTELVFFSNRDNPPGSFDLWAVRTDGTGLRRLTRVGAPRSVTQPVWSPDGSRLAFTVDVPNEVSEIWTVRPDGTDARNLTGTDGGFAPTWSPDGRRLAFVSQRRGDRAGRIYVMDADGSGARPVSRPRLGDTTPAWSPDGAHIAYESMRSGDEGPDTDIFVVRPDATGIRNLTRTPAAGERQPVWSPTGELLAFTRAFLRDDQVVVTGLRTGGVLDVSRGLQRADSWPTFRPDAGGTR